MNQNEINNEQYKNTMKNFYKLNDRTISITDRKKYPSITSNSNGSQI